MEPKFQSSFIPKGPIAAASPLAAQYVKPKKTILGLLSSTLFVIAIVLSIGVFGYTYYLRSNIAKMGRDLEAARATLQPDTVKELVNANKRIIGIETLLKKHTALSPFFDFLENTTLKTVRFTDFGYVTDAKGITIDMKGEARSYTDVALQSDAFNRSGVFKNPVFSNLNLNTKGNVTFSFKAQIDPSTVLYSKYIQTQPAAAALPAMSAVATTTAATSTPRTSAASTTATSTASSTKPLKTTQ